MSSLSPNFKDKLAKGDRERLIGLLKTAQAELLHLQQTDARLFKTPLNPDELVLRLQDIDFSERVDAFVARFGRLQDLLGDKFLPAWLKAMRRDRARFWKTWTVPKSLGFWPVQINGWQCASYATSWFTNTLTSLKPCTWLYMQRMITLPCWRKL